MKSKLIPVALFLAIAAFITAVGFPVYISYEKEKAYEYLAEMNAIQAERSTHYPLVFCVHGHARIESYSSGIPVSSSVWSDGEFVECDDKSYRLNGKALSEIDVLNLGHPPA